MSKDDDDDDYAKTTTNKRMISPHQQCREGNVGKKNRAERGRSDVYFCSREREFMETKNRGRGREMSEKRNNNDHRHGHRPDHCIRGDDDRI